MITAKSLQDQSPQVRYLAGDQVITPTITLYAEPPVVRQGESVTLYGFLNIPFDPDKNNFIDVMDLMTVARAYGSYPGHPNWNPDADINKDGFVDVMDLLILASLYGQTAAGKPIEIQKLEGENWVTVARLTTSFYEGVDGYFSFQYEVTEAPPTTLYFRAYFPGGEY